MREMCKICHHLPFLYSPAVMICCEYCTLSIIQFNSIQVDCVNWVNWVIKIAICCLFECEIVSHIIAFNLFCAQIKKEKKNVFQTVNRWMGNLCGTNWSDESVVGCSYGTQKYKHLSPSNQPTWAKDIWRWDEHVCKIFTRKFFKLNQKFLKLQINRKTCFNQLREKCKN